jgi:hypothetical protein
VDSFDSPGYVRRLRCSCKKISHPDEAAAALAAVRAGSSLNRLFTTYRCIGNACWHTTADGFQPSSLNASKGRRLAYEVLLHGEANLDEFRYRVFGLYPSDAGRGAWKRVSSIARAMVDLGLVTRHDVTIRQADRDGLRRVVQIGLEGYRAERAAGTDSSRPASAE